MPKTVQSADFSGDKQSFFSRVSSIQAAEQRAQHQNYQFLANNRLLIEQEFNQLFATLQKEGRDRQEFWLYCYYCCTMLNQYYSSYDKPAQAEKYRKQMQALKYRIENGSFEQAEVAEKPFLDDLQQQIANDLGELASTPKHISKIRDWLSFSNIYRIHFVFCRLAVMQSLLVVGELNWLSHLGDMFGLHIDNQSMISVIKAPTAVFNALSVGLFAARLIINAGMLLKHTFAPTHDESTLKTKERFYLEWKKRQCDFLNDMVWATVNGLTNYSSYFNIAAPVANWLLSGFLVFDVALLMYRRHLVKQDYLIKKEQYILERSRFQVQMQGAQLPPDVMHLYAERCRVLDEQLKQLEISWQTSSATYYFNVAAAALLMVGFSASLLFAAIPAAVMISYFVGVLAVAMYLTGDIYGKYKEKTLILEYAEKEYRDYRERALMSGEDESDETLKILEAAKNVATLEAVARRNDFIMAMVKNTVMPVIIVATFAACWEAALVLVAVYIGYECLHGYFNKPAAAPVPNKLAAPAAIESSDEEHEEAFDPAMVPAL